MVFLTNINLNKNEIQNAVIQPLATAPSSPKLGQIYFDSGDKHLKQWNGTSWTSVGMLVEASATNGKIKVDGSDVTVYTLPTAAANTLGGVKVGSGLTITNGVLSKNAPTWSEVTGKPEDLVEDASYVHTDNNYTTTEKNKLANIAAGAEVNVNADWNSNSGDSQILNKPTIDASPTSGHSSNLVSSGGVYTAIENAITAGTNVYWAEYDSTTYAEITAALSAEKIVVMEYSNRYYYLTANTLSTYFFVAPVVAMGAMYTYVATCNDADSWYDSSVHDITDDDLSIALGNYLPLSGGTLAGALTLSGAPTANLHAATKKYVDDGLSGKVGKASLPTAGNFMSFNSSGDAADSGKKAADFAAASHTHSYLPLTGGTLTGALTLSGAPSANLHAATKKYVDDAVGALATITISVVSSLPTTGSSNVIYLVPKSTAQTNNVYDEYVWVASTSKFEKIGDTEIDLSGYLTTSGNASSTTVAFTAASSRALPATGESLATIIGKATKYFTDLKAVAFSGSYSDLSNKPTLPSINTATMSTSETTKSITATGTTVVNVQIVDSVTHEVIVADVTINGKAVTVTVAAAPTNALTITVLSI